MKKETKDTILLLVLDGLSELSFFISSISLFITIVLWNVAKITFLLRYSLGFVIFFTILYILFKYLFLKKYKDSKTVYKWGFLVVRK